MPPPDHLPPDPAQIVVLANPTAGRGSRAHLLPAILGRLAATGRPVRVLDAPGRDAALAAAHRAVAAGAAALVAVGGDGTVHLAVQAVAGTSTPLGVVPTGTGNDVAAALGVPADPLAAADAAVAAVDSASFSRVDLARVTTPSGGSRWYAGVLGAGFDAIVNERANRMRFPRGAARYDVAILVELCRLKARSYTVTVDGVDHRMRAVLVAVGNTASYGGGMRICPAADPYDGLLDVVIGAAMSRVTLIRIKPRVYAGSHVTHPLVSQLRGRTVTITAERVTAYADGEPVLPLPVTITAVTSALLLAGGSRPASPASATR